MLLGEILSWSLMGVKEDEALPPSLHVWGNKETGTWDRKACIEKRREGKKVEIMQSQTILLKYAHIPVKCKCVLYTSSTVHLMLNAQHLVRKDLE